jgi:hypothetical protein
MSTSITDTGRRQPRVRHQARDALVLMAFSAGVSVTLSLLMMAALSLGRQG